MNEPKPRVTRDDIEKGLRSLGFNAPVVVHASLSAFGFVEGGAEAIADALLAVFPTVMVPTFTHGNVMPPPEELNIPNNGVIPSWYDWLETQPLSPFTADTPSHQNISVVSEVIRKRPGALRSSHPSHSFAAIGPDSAKVLATQTMDDPLAPIVTLLQMGGWVLMLGARITSCTELHASEHVAGRNYFVRLAVDESGENYFARSPGCSTAYVNFEPIFAPILREVYIGNARVHAYPGPEFLDLSVNAIKANPEITRCRPDCIACRDCIAGGPP